MHHLNQGILGLGDPIRWMIRRDMPVVLAIEAASDRRPWNEGDFRRHLALPHCIGQVAEPDGRVVGFQVYSLTKTGIHLHRFGVDPESRRQGVGSRLLTRLMAKLSSQRRTVVTAYLREANLAGQLFLRARGSARWRSCGGFSTAKTTPTRTRICSSIGLGSRRKDRTEGGSHDGRPGTEPIAVLPARGPAAVPRAGGALAGAAFGDCRGLGAALLGLRAGQPGGMHDAPCPGRDLGRARPTAHREYGLPSLGATGCHRPGSRRAGCRRAGRDRIGGPCAGRSPTPGDRGKSHAWRRRRPAAATALRPERRRAAGAASRRFHRGAFSRRGGANASGYGPTNATACTYGPTNASGYGRANATACT